MTIFCSSVENVERVSYIKYQVCLSMNVKCQTLTGTNEKEAEIYRFAKKILSYSLKAIQYLRIFLILVMANDFILNNDHIEIYLKLFVLDTTSR